MKKLILIITLLFSISAYSQDSMDFNTVDKKTYDYYMAEKWDSLIELGNKAIENNIDYFYLRSRLGAAYYAKHKYVLALSQFEKAQTFNSTNNFVIESIYNCYIHLNQDNEAEYVFKTNPLVFEKKKKSGIFRGVFIESGRNNTGNNIHPFFTNHPPDIIWAETDVAKQNTYFGGGLNFAFGKNALVTASYENLQIENTRIILIGPDTLNDNYTIQQNQVYLNSSYRLGKGIRIIPAFHYLQVNYQTIFSEFKPSENKVILDRHSVSLNDFASSLFIVKNYNYSSFAFGLTYSQLNNTKPIQLGVGFTTYPFGNLNFYTITNLNFQKMASFKNLIGEQSVGCKIFKHLWLDGFVTLGRLDNYVEQNAYVVYNINDVITFRTGAGAIVPIGKFKISFRYSYLEKESFIKTFQPPNAHRYVGPPPLQFKENYYSLTISYKL